MEETTYCVWCGCENPADRKQCCQCGKSLEAKENLLVDFLLDHTKDKLKGDVEDGIYDAVKNYLLSHLYSVIIAVALGVTAVAAVVTTNPAPHIKQVIKAPAPQIVVQTTAPQQETVQTTAPQATTEATVPPEETEPAAYVLTQEDKQQIEECLGSFAECMRYTRYVGDDYEYLDYLISDALEEELGYDSYVDMYPDMVDGDIYQYNYCESGEVVIDQETWGTAPLTQNTQQLVDMGYTVATFYADHYFYGRRTGSSTAQTELLGSPRYLVTFTVEDGKWLLVEQINVTDRLEERQDALL